MENHEPILEVSRQLDLQPVAGSYDELFSQLSKAVNELLNTNFDRLISILYRLDVNENKLRSLLNANPAEDAGKLIARLMIERQAEKIASRKKYKSPPPDGGENEKW